MGNLRDINLISILVRTVLAIVFGAVLGLERERKNRPAGFRTYMLVCVGAALVMMTNQYVAQVYDTGDPVRMGAQVVSGIGFLGAGTIMVTGRNKIRGITTAAGLWTAACSGLAIGIGFYEGALVGGVAIFVIISIMHRLEDPIRRHSKYLEIYLEFENSRPFGEFITYAREHELDVFDLQIQKGHYADGENFISAVLLARGPQKMPHSDILELLSAAPGVRFLEELR